MKESFSNEVNKKTLMSPLVTLGTLIMVLSLYLYSYGPGKWNNLYYVSGALGSVFILIGVVRIIKSAKDSVDEEQMMNGDKHFADKTEIENDNYSSDDYYKSEETNMCDTTHEEFNKNGETGSCDVNHVEYSQTNELNHSFLLEVKDVFVIAGRGTVATGTVKEGQILTGANVTIKRTGKKYVVNGIEAFRKVLDVASVGDDIGLLISCERNDVQTGDIIIN